MKLSELYKRFSDESVCRQILKKIRENEGVICKKCEGIEHYWKKDKKCFECKICKFRTSLKSGTIMENSNLPIKYWLSAIIFLEITKKDISALEVQKEFGHKRYEPIWLMLKKIKTTPIKTNYIYKFLNCIEPDELFFVSENNEKDNSMKTNI